MRHVLALLLLCTLAGAARAQGSVRLAEAGTAEQRAGSVVVTWRTAVETGVRSFEVLRRSPATRDQFVVLKNETARGASRYEVVDDDLYKSIADARAEYEVWTVYDGGTRTRLFTVQVNYTTTGLRRTWGSLKAMFQ